MTLRAWRIWGIGVLVVGVLPIFARPPELPVKPEVNGKVPSPIAQEFHQVEAVPPRILPESLLDPRPVHGPDQAIAQAALWSGSGPDQNHWKARVAFEQAELHFDACEMEEAKGWYREVIKLAPACPFAKIAAERLRPAPIVPAGAKQSREPPLADAAASESTVRIPSISR